MYWYKYFNYIFNSIFIIINYKNPFYVYIQQKPNGEKRLSSKLFPPKKIGQLK